MSEVLNLEEFKSPRVTNTRVAKEAAVVSYDLKYRDGTFTIASAIWNKLGLDSHSLALKINPANNVALFLVVGEEEGDIAKRTPKTGLKKFKTFKSNVLEAALVAQGILTKTEYVKGVESYNQMFSLQETPTSTGVTAYVIVPEGTATASNAATTSIASEAAETGSDAVPSAASNQPETGDLIASAGVVEDENFDEKF